MEDVRASKTLKEEIPDEEGHRSLQNLKVEKLGFQSSSGGTTQEPAGMESCLVGTHEAHGRKPKKKPDKPLPCPRCESFDTKFCYFNNYNVNQPRHFCRKCQRYWTAGGLLRNVPRGAGRRRSKYSMTHQKLSNAKEVGCDANDMVPLDVGRLVCEDGLSASSTMLSFGQQKPLCDVMAVHSLSGQQPNMTKASFNEWCPSHVRVNTGLDRLILEHESNGMRASTSISYLEDTSRPATLKHDHRMSEGLGVVPHYSQEKDGNVSSSSRILNTESNGLVTQEERGENLGLHTAPWRKFDAAKDRSTSTSASHCSNIPWFNFSSMKGVTPSNFNTIHGHYDDSAKEKPMSMASNCAKTSEGTLSAPTWLNGFPSAMWAHPPWSFMPSGPPALDWATVYWHMPWFLAALASSSSTIRRPGLQAGSEAEGCLLIPKTLRIDDPVEAAQSSIWKTLGLDKAPGSSEGITKAFQCEAGTEDEEESSTPSQHSNPAALSRSLTFNETT